MSNSTVTALARRVSIPACLLLAAMAMPAHAVPTDSLTIQRAAGPIVIDGDLSDAGWQGLPRITKWYETRVGDNVEPQVANLAYLAYDDKYFYAGFEFTDPDPKAIRAPLGDHDNVPSSTDYGGVILDGFGGGKTAQMFLANPHGVQYDASSSDASGEDNAPDYFWDSMGKVTATGWALEIRIPFSSMRYANVSDPTWGVLLYRNYPRDRRYQFFNTRLPRDVNCFICNSAKMTGLAQLPQGSHLVVAPYASASQTSLPEAGLGSSLHAEDIDSEFGLDVKWSPFTGTTLDGTINPDFSQIESDAAQIVANERFALFFAEKRPFFLEGVDLLSTPMQAVYTRTVTAPRAGARVTGKAGSTAYTALFTQDRGGGLVILPGPQGSSDALQDFESNVGVFRMRHDLGRSFVSVLGTTREIIGGGYNRVVGPDFEWRPKSTETVRGQLLWSDTETPDRPDLATEWDGRTLQDHAAQVSWSHSTPKVDWYLQGQDFGEDFRANNGFIPQVGYREIYAETGYTIRPKDQFLSRVRLFTFGWVDAEPDGDELFRRYAIGSGMDGKFNSFLRVELNRDEVRVGTEIFQRFRPYVLLESSPGRVFNFLSVSAFFGDEIDFANAREASGVTLTGTLSVRPTDHFELRADASRRWIEVDTPTQSGRLFTAEVERLRGTYSFSSRAFLRLIGQYVQTRRDPTLYTFAVGRKVADFSSSALFAYKLNWQTVLYAGYGDQRTFYSVTDQLEESGRQAFAKVSYAWQH